MPSELGRLSSEKYANMGVMPMNVNRWLKYAKAKLDDTLASGNEELDKLEARQEAERAGKPWLGSVDDAPSFDDARARIAWEAEQAGRAAAAGNDPDDRTPGGRAGGTDAHRPASPSPATNTEGSDPTDPHTTREAAERSAAQIVLDQRAEESAARLAAIRAELGVDDPATPPV